MHIWTVEICTAKSRGQGQIKRFMLEMMNRWSLQFTSAEIKVLNAFSFCILKHKAQPFGKIPHLTFPTLNAI